ncbi:MAG: hypothetical protein EOO75_13020 [Myxococcales bacterium]|nr:MAG: hypothetical protein EOO75_13020 [Myxococcales bacterium]
MRPRGYDFTSACAFATDDGRPVALSAAERSALLGQALDHRSLGAYWHVDRPGRDPLRIVRTPLVPADERRMFGSPVAWIEPAAATPGTAYLTVTRLDATSTRATLTLAYPVEGVVGTFTFRRPRATWELVQGVVSER